MAIDKERLLENEYVKNFFDIFNREGSIKPDKCNDREKKELERLRKAHLIKFRKKTNDYVFEKKHKKRFESIPKKSLRKQKTDDRKYGRGQCYYLIIENIEDIDSTEWIKFLDRMNFNTFQSTKKYIEIEYTKKIDKKYRIHIELSTEKCSVHFENYLDHTGYKSERAKNELMKFKKRIEDEFPEAEIKFDNKSKPTKELKRLKKNYKNIYERNSQKEITKKISLHKK